jgi:hypothetical protein
MARNVGKNLGAAEGAMHVVARTIVFVGLAIAVGLGPARAACDSTGKVLLQDQFDKLARGWGRYANYHVEKGELLITPPAKHDTAALNRAVLPADLDVCVDANFKLPTVADACASIVFWGIDYDNYYSLQISNNGEAAVWRLERGQWLELEGWLLTRSVNKTGDAANELRVVTRGNQARFYINDQFYIEVPGNPVKGGNKVGLLACSPNKSAGIVAFDNLIVKPAGPEPAEDTATQSGAQ